MTELSFSKYWAINFEMTLEQPFIKIKFLYLSLPIGDNRGGY